MGHRRVRGACACNHDGWSAISGWHAARCALPQGLLPYDTLATRHDMMCTHWHAARCTLLPQGLLPYDMFATKLLTSPARMLALEPEQKVRALCQLVDSDGVHVFNH